MARNFDELLEADLTFTIGGETFTMQYVRPEVLAEWEDEPNDDTPAAEILARTTERMCLFLVEGDRDRFRSLRERTEKPIASVQLNALVRWMIEVQSGRPTQTPSLSGDGSGSAAPGSQARSPRRAAPRRA